MLTALLLLASQAATSKAATMAGISSYLVTRNQASAEVVLLGKNRQRLGTLHLSSEADRLTLGGHTLTTTTKETETDTTVTMTYDDQSFTATYTQWPSTGWAISGMPDAEAKTLILAQGKLLTLVSEVRHELGIKDPLPRRHPTMDRPTNGPRSTMPGTNTGGSSMYCASSFLCKGLSGRVTKGDACYIAEERANECCTNEVCWGCCALQECNHLCVVGDFICAAEVHGAWCVEPI